MKDIVVRSITGSVFVLVLVLAIMYNKVATSILFSLFSLVGLYEFYMLTKKGQHHPQIINGLLGGLSLTMIIVWSQFLIDWWLFLLIPLLFLLSVVPVIRALFKDGNQSIVNISITVFGWIYIVTPFVFLISLRGIGKWEGYHLLLGFFIALWVNDTGAYLVGNLAGKTKLFERISPKKTWEGFIGGAVLAVITGIAYGYLTELSILHWAIMSFLIGVFGTLGDLSVSQLKRSVGAKDSGSLFPGHGGVLDRFDGALLAAPVIFAYYYFFKQYMA